MFEQIDDPEVAGKKTWKERLTEGAIILAVVTVVIGIIVYALLEVGQGSNNKSIPDAEGSSGMLDQGEGSCVRFPPFLFAS